MASVELDCIAMITTYYQKGNKVGNMSTLLIPCHLGVGQPLALRQKAI